MSRPTPAKRTTRARRSKPLWKRIKWKRVGLLGLALLVVPFVSWVLALYMFGHIPEPNEIARSESVIVVDRHGKTVGRIHGGADRISVPLREMPKTLREAVIATEDRRFYKHPGVSVPSIFRAALSNIFGKGRQGGSTITQQYVKNAFVGNERSMARKVKEAVVAVKLERQRSKDEILELYLNTIYLGRGAYGCEAAARIYFNKRCRQLGLTEGALLAGMIKSPEQLDPVRNADEAKARRDAVIGFMVGEKYITEKEGAAARRAPLRARPRTVGGIAPHFVEELRAELEERFGARRLYSGDIARIVSTLDLDMQRAAVESVRETFPGDRYGVIGEGRGRGKRVEAAVVSIDPKTGEVRALVGSRDYAKMQLNLATRARRQPGSTFKPVVLAEWIDDGKSIRDKFDGSSPKEVAGQTIHNYGGEDKGSISVEQATWDSVNTVYAQMIVEEGATQAVEMAKRLGVTSPMRPQVGLTLGDQEVTPIELAKMFTTFAARGVVRDPSMVLRVVDRKGKTIFRGRDQGSEGVDPDVADAVNYVLQGVVENGTGRPAQIGRPAAGKTGTTQDSVDAWFAGYTPDLVTVVWNGVPRAFLPLEDVRGKVDGVEREYESLFGGSFPAAIWKGYMREALEGVPPTPFPKPKLVEPSRTASPSPTPTPTRTLPTTAPAPTVAPPPGQDKKTPTPKPKPSPTPTPSPSPTQAEGG